MKTVLIAALVSLAAAPAALAQPMAVESSIIVTGQNQEDWRRGSALEADGLKALEKARKDLVKYSADVVAAQSKRDLASQRADNARDVFLSLTTAGTNTTDAKDSLRWAKRLEEAASEWSKQEARGRDGGQDLEKAMKRQTRAQSQVDEAQAKVDLGRKLKIDAERSSAQGV